MAAVSTYLNFSGTAEEAMAFYASVFETELTAITRYGDFGGGDGIPEHARSLLMNSQMPILGGHLLQASDHLEDFGGPLTVGNNVSVVLMTDSPEETRRLFALLAEGGEVRQEPVDAGFGYFADLCDKFGINWMFYNAAE